jgi:hypothetical protein
MMARIAIAVAFALALLAMGGTASARFCTTTCTGNYCSTICS